MPPSPGRVRARRSRDPLERAIEAALGPGRFISERARYTFVSDLDEVVGDLARLVESEPQWAAALRSWPAARSRRTRSTTPERSWGCSSPGCPGLRTCAR